MIISGSYEVPNTCPKDCSFRGSLVEQGQSAICGRCPVFTCSPCTDEKGGTFYLVTPEDYRKDWAEEWVKFFKNNKYRPNLIY